MRLWKKFAVGIAVETNKNAFILHWLSNCFITTIIVQQNDILHVNTSRTNNRNQLNRTITKSISSHELIRFYGWKIHKFYLYLIYMVYFQWRTNCKDNLLTNLYTCCSFGLFQQTKLPHNRRLHAILLINFKIS